MDIILAVVLTAVLLVSVLPGALEEFNDSLFNKIYYTAALSLIALFYIVFIAKMWKKINRKKTNK
ncbi:MAG: hypothetical protein EA344_11425 [Alkalicoccus sp.]|nr:MAG: hypothetical protein EA344_11425 [Alkalicoccus sp.]